MPPLSALFGELERALGTLYPYRLPIAAVAVLGALAVALLIHRRGVDRALLEWARAHRAVAGGLALAAVAIALPLGNYTLSPLWERSVIEERSPLEVARAVTTPMLAPAAPASSEPATSAMPRVVRTGTLQGADAFHFGRGRVLLIDDGSGRHVLRFEELSVRNGPDLFVYLAPSAGGVADAVNLGGLKGTDGSFNYELPAQLDLASLGNALIWCRQFGVLFASATLSEAS